MTDNADPLPNRNGAAVWRAAGPAPPGLIYRSHYEGGHEDGFKAGADYERARILALLADPATTDTIYRQMNGPGPWLPLVLASVRALIAGTEQGGSDDGV